MFYLELIKRLYDRINEDPDLPDSIKEQAKQLLQYLANMLY